MVDIVVLGAGGYARQIVWAIQRGGSNRVVGMVDETLLRVSTYREIPIFPGIQELVSQVPLAECKLIAGVGRQDVRRRWVNGIYSEYEFTTVVDPSALVAPDAIIGRNVVVLGNSICSSLCEIGDSVNVNWLCLVSHDVRIGAFSNLATGVKLAGGAEIGEECEIGTNASVLPKVKVGDRSVIGAGAVVTSDVPADVVAAGVPARIIKDRR